MSDDDSTAGHWEPLADQPIVPPPHEPAPRPDAAPAHDAVPPEFPHRSPWAPPAYGPPPSAPTYAAPSPSGPTYAAPSPGGPFPYTGPPGFPPPGNVWASPDTAYGGYGDYVESPARRRRSPRLVISSVVVLVLVVVGSGVALFAHSSHSQSSSSPLPSQAARPQPSPSAQVPSPSEGSATPPSGNTAAAGPLDDYLLAPADVGAARMTLFPNGRGLDGEFGATLDFCNYHYTTESSRKARVQVTYQGGAQQVSNEFVRYQPGGAQQAFAELKKAVSACPSSFQESDGTVSNIEQAPIIKSLVADHVTLTFAVTTNGLGGQQTLWTTAVYQFDGDFFSGVYVYGADKAPVEQFAASLGAKAAKHIMEAAQGKPGTGGGPMIQQGDAPQQPGVPAAFR